MNTTERIFDLLEKRNITAKALSLATDISTGNISDWKSNKANPSYGAIVKISKFLNVSEKYLQCETDDQNPQQDSNKEKQICILLNKLNEVKNEDLSPPVKTALERASSFLTKLQQIGESASQHLEGMKYIADTLELPPDELESFYPEDVIEFAEDYFSAEIGWEKTVKSHQSGEANETILQKLIVPDSLKGVQAAFNRGEFEDLTQDEVDALAVVAKTLKAQRKGE